MDIHHAMIVHKPPERVYEALTQPNDLKVWMDAPTTARPEVGSVVAFQFEQGQAQGGRSLIMEITRLEAGKLVQWRVVQPMWPGDTSDQVLTWTLTPFEVNTHVDFRMAGWKQDDSVYASVSYKWAAFMTALKMYLGEPRDIAAFLPVVERNIAANK
jgi:uncharacterized protein YndB with AHSA1/START domain